MVIRRRGSRLGLIAMLVLVSAGLGGLGGYALSAYRHDPDRYSFSPAPGGSELDRLREERRRLARELRAARTEAQDLRGRNTFDARSCAIDVQACEAVRKSVGTLESEVADLREQLAFYRNIVSPEQARAGVRVLRLAVRPTGPADIWRYELVLVQPVRRDRTATGTYDFALEGLIGKQLRTLQLDDLRAGAAGPASANRFSFRSFQEFSGELRLPSGFRPTRLKVTLHVQDGKAAPGEVSETFEWSRLVMAGKE